MVNIHKFYTSKAWRELRAILLHERLSYCEECSGFFSQSELVAHHIKPITHENIHDANITLNSNNIKLLCAKCHNRIHERLFKPKASKSVYIIWGAPCSGKTSYVNELLEYGDIIFDIDSVWQAVSGQERYIKPEQCKAVIFGLRDSFFDMVATRSGKWNNAYIITSVNHSYVDSIRGRLHAELVIVPTSKDICLERAKKNRPEEFVKYIDDWFKFNGQYLIEEK